MRASCESAREIEHTIEDVLAELESEMKKRPNSMELSNKALRAARLCAHNRPATTKACWAKGARAEGVRPGGRGRGVAKLPNPDRCVDEKCRAMLFSSSPRSDGALHWPW